VGFRDSDHHHCRRRPAVSTLVPGPHSQRGEVLCLASFYFGAASLQRSSCRPLRFKHR
jgi:hypothetical protein